ncbi:MAG: HprK-related kinase B, partial [Desulfovibrionaceae bacterium]
QNPNQVVNFVNNRFIEHLLNQGCLLGHASGIALAGHGLALAGFAGAGKSTLALHAMSLGADLVSNDRVLVRPGRPPRFFGVAKHPRINPGTALNNPDLAGVLSDADRARFTALPPKELWNLEHKYDAIVEECFGPGRFRLAAPMNGLMILHWTHGGGPARIRPFDPRKRHDLLAAFMKATGSFYLPAPGLPQDQPVERYAETLAECACIEVDGGVDFDAAARACLDLLKTGALPHA